MKYTSREIVYLGVFIAINIILTRLASIKLVFGGVEYLRLGFGTLPLVFASILIGPKQGMLVGIIGDIIGYQLNPSGIFLPQFTLIAGLNGLLPGLCMKLFRLRIVFLQLVFALVVTHLITTVLLTPYVLWQVFGIPFIINIPPRLITLLITAPLFAYLFLVIERRLPSMNFRKITHYK